MNLGEKVQVRRFDGVDHWVFAVVQDPATNRVQITHPGNREDGNVLLASSADIRTKADVENILAQVQPILAKVGPRGMTAAQIRQLAQLDGFWSSFLEPANGALTEAQSKHLSAQQATLHQRVAKHYQEQLKRL